MKTFATNGTGSQQTLTELDSEKIPVYDTLEDAESDLANLAENQIIATHDTGSELSAPVDVVQSGNMHAVTSNAVAESLSYSTTEQATGGKWINGKPIYRKVFKFTTQCTHLTEFSLPYANNLIQCYLCTPENAYFSCSPYVYPVNTRGQSNFAIKCTWTNDTNWQSSEGFLLVEYTKSTD